MSDWGFGAKADMLKSLTSGVAPAASCARAGDQVVGTRSAAIFVEQVVLAAGSHSIVTLSYGTVIPLHWRR